MQAETTHASFGLLHKASHAAPTPHLDKLLSGAASWWSGVTGKLARPANAKQPPRRIPQPHAMMAADAGPKPPTHRTPAHQSLERAQHLKPKVSAAPPAAPAPTQSPPAAAAKQVSTNIKSSNTDTVVHEYNAHIVLACANPAAMAKHLGAPPCQMKTL